MTLLTVACGLFFIFAILYQYVIAWTILLGSAAFDGLVYLIVGDVVVCYRCGAKHRGIASKSFAPFELATAERYRQERLRRDQIERSRRGSKRALPLPRSSFTISMTPAQTRCGLRSRQPTPRPASTR
jgi:hypothetical protein